MLVYSSASILPSILPGPWVVIQPHTMRDPPPNLTVPLTCWSVKPDPGLFQHQTLPSDPNPLILLSSDQMTLDQSSKVQCTPEETPTLPSYDTWKERAFWP